MNKRHLPFFLMIFIAGFVTHLAFSMLISTVKISNVATLKTIGVSVFWDIQASSPVLTIDWGVMEPSQTVTKLVYVRNDGNVPITLIVLTENWQPLNASKFVTLNTDYSGAFINPKVIIPLELSLYISTDITGGITKFTFDIIIAASG